MTIEKIAARYTHNFVSFDDYLVVVFKYDIDEDNFYRDLIDYGDGVRGGSQMVAFQMLLRE